MKDYMDSSLNEVIGSVLKTKRENQGLSLEELSNKMDNKIKRQNIAYYENARSRLKLNKFLLICEALQLEPNEVFDEIQMKYFKNAKIDEDSYKCM